MCDGLALLLVVVDARGERAWNGAERDDTEFRLARAVLWATDGEVRVLVVVALPRMPWFCERAKARRTGAKQERERERHSLCSPPSSSLFFCALSLDRTPDQHQSCTSHHTHKHLNIIHPQHPTRYLPTYTHSQRRSSSTSSSSLSLPSPKRQRKRLLLHARENSAVLWRSPRSSGPSAKSRSSSRSTCRTRRVEFLSREKRGEQKLLLSPLFRRLSLCLCAAQTARRDCDRHCIEH
jgi:hypothetical protein